ncbi:unnamed protein product [marine sediment metagenome]|uniref:Uncharacterized protein n=1 Tax=marine sediment metagenome TaxID=412755 RepID=X1RZA1_9ZZZZ
MKKKYAVYYHLKGQKKLRRASSGTFESITSARKWAKKSIPSPYKGKRTKYKKVYR